MDRGVMPLALWSDTKSTVPIASPKRSVRVSLPLEVLVLGLQTCSLPFRGYWFGIEVLPHAGTCCALLLLLRGQLVQ